VSLTLLVVAQLALSQQRALLEHQRTMLEEQRCLLERQQASVSGSTALGSEDGPVILRPAASYRRAAVPAAITLRLAEAEVPRALVDYSTGVEDSPSPAAIQP
jgi:hypothetical protein